MRTKDKLVNRVSWWILSIIILVVILSSILFNPSNSVLAPKCLLYVKTGIKCPACGIQRSIFHLSRGNLMEAMTENALFFFGLLALIFYFVLSLIRRLQKKSMPSALKLLDRWIWILLLITVLFTIFRNILSN